MRNTFAETLYACAKEDPRIYIVAADISPAGSMEKFRQEYPERFINVGVAEQTMIGMTAGLALQGARPFAYTIAAFSLYRPFEMVRDDLCYQNIPVTVVGMGSGVVYSTLGGTHHTMEDVAIASAIPNMQILSPCDPLETVDATRWCAVENKGPAYLRIGKAGEPKITANAVEPFRFGKIRHLRRGTDTCILSYGPITKMGMDVADALAERGESVSVVSVHTVKPLDVAGIRAALHGHKRVIVIEENVPHGGLASRVCEIAWESKAQCELFRFTLKDEFIHAYGSYEELLEAHGISVAQILKGIGLG
jgi:transketolase